SVTDVRMEHLEGVIRITGIVRFYCYGGVDIHLPPLGGRVWCSNCAVEVAEQEKFCRQCGSPAGRRCPARDATNPASSKFCGDCGTKLRADSSAVPATARYSRPIERRQLSVLFCDLVGSTALSARLDPEDFGAIIARYRRCISETVAGLDGFV